MKHPPCIFCDNESGSPEHLWPDWMHNLVRFAPINMQEADGTILFGQDAEQTIDTVCGDCNHGWMSQIEQKNVSRLKPMLLNTPIPLDSGGMKILTEWAVLRAMVADSVKPKNNNESFYTRQERLAFRHSLTIPARTRVWVGALINSKPDEYHIGCHGTDYTIMIDEGKTRIGTGSVSTIYAGHFVFQTVTEHLTPPYVCKQQALITPPPSPVDERLMEIYPTKSKQLDWPTERFTESGPTGVTLGLFGRWHMGERASKIKNA